MGTPERLMVAASQALSDSVASRQLAQSDPVRAPQADWPAVVGAPLDAEVVVLNPHCWCRCFAVQQDLPKGLFRVSQIPVFAIKW